MGIKKDYPEYGGLQAYVLGYYFKELKKAVVESSEITGNRDFFFTGLDFLVRELKFDEDISKDLKLTVFDLISAFRNEPEISKWEEGNGRSYIDDGLIINELLGVYGERLRKVSNEGTF